jgi:hypothetical protein
MSTPAELVDEAFSQAQTYINDAEAKLASSVTAMNEAIQNAPTVDITFAAISGPSVDAAPTPDMGDAPTYTAPATYTSSLISTLASLLGTRLAGGTGLAPAVETAIWDRARDREAALAQANIDEVTRTHEALGFHLPTGVLAAQVREAQRDYYTKTSTLSRDIAVKQAELEQSNMTDAVQRAIAYEDTLASILQRREQVAVDAFRAEVETFNAHVTAYRVEVEAYSAQIESDIKHWEVEIKQLEAQATYTLTGQKMNSDIIRANLATALEAAKIAAQMYAQLAAAGYSMIHASAGGERPSAGQRVLPVQQQHGDRAAIGHGCLTPVGVDRRGVRP